MNFITDYDNAYDNSSYVGYTSPNWEVMQVLSGVDGDFEGVNAYLPRTNYENDEVFEYNAQTRKIISNMWAKVKISASNAN
jgi:spermidine/putrescine transport system permease protein